MIETNGGKKVDSREGIVQDLTEKLKRVEDESSEKIKKSVVDLEARHAEEIRILREKIVKKEKKIDSDIAARLVEEKRILQEETAAQIKKSVSDLEFRHALELQRLQGEGEQREKNVLKDFKVESQAQTKVLVTALLKTKFERDRLILAVSWAAIVIVTILACRSGMQDSLTKGFTFAALAGFIGSIIFVRQSLKRNSRYWASVKAGTIQSDPIWEEADVKPTVFMLLGSIAALLLGLPMFLNTPVKDVYPPQPAGLTEHKAPSVSVKAADTAKVRAVAAPAAAEPATSAPIESNSKTISGVAASSDDTDTVTSVVKTTGNGGNFVGGIFR